jgi:hypothetical protein
MSNKDVEFKVLVYISTLGLVDKVAFNSKTRIDIKQRIKNRLIYILEYENKFELIV